MKPSESWPSFQKQDSYIYSRVHNYQDIYNDQEYWDDEYNATSHLLHEYKLQSL